MFFLSKKRLDDHVSKVVEERLEEFKQELMERLEGEDIAEKILSTHTASRIIGECVEGAFQNEDYPLDKRIQDILDDATIDISVRN